MTTNRLAKPDNGPILPTDRGERRRYLLEQGNLRLWGKIPNSKGEWLPPRPDLQWHCVDGNWFIGPRAGWKK